MTYPGRHSSRWLNSLVAAALLALLPPMAISEAAPPPAYETYECGFTLDGTPRRLECGTLTVPARRDETNAGAYRLAVLIMKAHGKNSGPPVLFINGGPGSPSIGSPEIASALWSGFLSELDWLEGRDLIVFDPRGVGQSEPAIACPDVLIKLHIDDSPKRARKSLRKCWSRLRKEGLDLATFNTREAVEDIIDLREALGIESWVTWGVSYGTRVALKLLEQDPDGIESAILMGVYPPGIDSMLASTVAFAEALEKVFETCDDDPECKKAYPDLRQTFAGLIEKRRAWPKAISAFLTRTGWQRNHRFELDDALILGILHGALYDSSTISELPGFIAELAAGRFDRTRIILDMVDFNTFGPHAGLEPRIIYYCNDVPPGASDDREEARARFPLFDSWVRDAQRRELCHSADLGAPETFLSQSLDPEDRPTLILNGDFDPVTPSVWAAEVAEKLPRSYFFRFAGNGHDTHLNDCAKSIIAQFLGNPLSEPDGACLRDQPLPAFQTADTTQDRS